MTNVAMQWLRSTALDDTLQQRPLRHHGGIPPGVVSRSIDRPVQGVMQDSHTPPLRDEGAFVVLSRRSKQHICP